MEELPYLVSAPSHDLEPSARDPSQLTSMLFHPDVDGWATLDSSVQSKKFHSGHSYHLRSNATRTVHRA